jgi:O-antigen/teichoic acid export membrane protein
VETCLLRSFLNILTSLHRRSLAKDASWMLAGQASNFLLRAAYFVILARLLGVVQFGIFSGVVALVNVIAPYSALGGGLLFMRHVSRDKSAGPTYWGNALLTTAVMTVIITGSLMALGPLITGNHSMVLLVNMVIGNCLFTRTLDVASKVYRTYHKIRLSATLAMLSNFSQFIVVLIMWMTMRHATAAQWSIGQLIATGVTTLVTLAMVHSVLRAISFDFGLMKRQFWEGLTYTFSTTSQAVYNDFDKTLLSHYGFNLENGFYTLAYRIIDFSFTPIGAIDLALLPRLFSLAHKDVRQLFRLAFKAVSAAVGIGGLVAIGLWVVAPMVPHLVGRDYGPVLSTLRWLALIPLLRGIHIVLGNSLTATGRQPTRMTCQFIVAGINLLLNVWLIPIYGWRGAAWSSLVSDGTLAILILVLVTAGARRVVRENPTALTSVGAK